ncbi:MAG: hypothetical protein J5614_03460 [Paludibacteraceae bacterium]|nr:hypothetical protein [Paludibacteraceae bacterium]
MKSKHDTRRTITDIKSTASTDFSRVISETIGMTMHRMCQDHHILALCDNIGDRLEWTMEYFCNLKRRKTSYLDYNNMKVVVLFDDGNLVKCKFNVRLIDDGKLVEIEFKEE